ncbi:MAG: JmjC domain-containing protein, partial [Steroidobacteraceae bacterium]
AFPLRNIVPGPHGPRVHRFAHDGPPRLWERFAKPDEASFAEVVLGPGDLLCLPAGAWHGAQAIGHSLAINLAFNALSLDQLVISALRERLLAMPEWRRPIPPALGARSDGPVPAHVADFFAARLRELHSCVAALTPDGPELAHAWRERIYSRTASASDPSPACCADSGPLEPGDAFVRTALTGFGWSHDEAFAPALTIYQGAQSRSVQLPDTMEPFVRRLMSVHSFRASDCIRWAGRGSRYEWSEVEMMLRTLLDGRFIERADCTAGQAAMPAA